MTGGPRAISRPKCGLLADRAAAGGRTATAGSSTGELTR